MTSNVITHQEQQMKIISTENVMHHAGTRGVHIAKIQIAEISGERRELRYWYDYSSDSDTPYRIDNVPAAPGH